jgi:molecular chaperone GrpE
MKTKNPSVECTEINKEIYDKVVSEKEQLMEKLAEMQDKYIRLSAEYDNYRKRTLREKIDLSKHAGEEFFLKILPVMDDFERALAHLEQSNDFKSLKEGIELIYIKFTEFFKQSGVKEIDALNVPFDFELHDAVA